MGTRGGPRFAKIHFLEGFTNLKVTILFWEIKRYGFEFVSLVREAVIYVLADFVR